MSELRECPFCPDGGDPRVYCSSVAVIVHVECGKCGVTGDDFCESNDKKDEAVQRAIAAWNTRPADAVRVKGEKFLHAVEAYHDAIKLRDDVENSHLWSRELRVMYDAAVKFRAALVVEGK